MRPSRVVALVLSVLGGLVVTLLGLFVIGMRRKSPWLQDRVRQFSKTVGTPQALKSAGHAGVSNGVIHHVGRRSGAAYATPITPMPVPGGFLIALPYTSKADWASNVLSAGTAGLEFDGRRHTVVEPRVVSYAEAAPLLPRSARWGSRLFDTREFLRLTTAD